MKQSNTFETFFQQMQTSFPSMYEVDTIEEAIGITLCLMPLIQSDLLESIIKEELGTEGELPLVGGLRGTQHRGILPTGETWMYFCCKNEQQKRIHFLQGIPAYLSQSERSLNIEPALNNEPFLSGLLVFTNTFRHKFQKLNLVYEQRFSNLSLGSFIHSKLSLDDLVLSDDILQSIEEIKHWKQFQDSIKDAPILFTKRIKQGLKILFYGKAGTGKTETTAILGNLFGRKVYRIDISQIVSKYIGETEKNLSKLFEVAEHNHWILFFDEADALFGKRTSVSSSNDKYANQEVAYLLQRIEDYDGMVVLSSNLKDNIDEAFIRRFQIITEFHFPDAKQRRLIWCKLLAELSPLKVLVNEDEFSQLVRYELSGATITNIVNFAMMKARYTQHDITFNLLKEGIVRELRKEGRLSSIL